MKIIRVAVYRTIPPCSKGVYVRGEGNELRDSEASVVVSGTDACLRADFESPGAPVAEYA
ncbi:MAG: hypothetical protein OXF24_01495 [Hyphomicrobiales bacterium]|nr:hypothetical protein [Hyphomicrobiales bacterium]MCY4048244.1 hypothetical protein [Hyphomicrobiales bacterium]MCY4053303.1 hypothetical protein [Hyphomicrobiales bacterium]